MTEEQDDIMKKFMEFQMLKGIVPPDNKPDLEALKLKYDTDLAMAAQKFELTKLQHQWRIEERDSAAHQTKLELIEIVSKLQKIIERL